MRLKHFLFAAGILLGLCGTASIYGNDAATGPKNATVLIIRHADKKDPEEKSDPGLTLVGQDRAKKYVNYFRPFLDGSGKLTINALFAAEDSETSQRPRLTLEPLAQATGLPLDASIKKEKIEKLVERLKSGAYDGKTILICWHHGEIPDLLHLMGADANALLGGLKWPADVFGWVVILHFGADGSLQSSKVVNAKLENNDQRDPPKAVMGNQ